MEKEKVPQALEGLGVLGELLEEVEKSREARMVEEVGGEEVEKIGKEGGRGDFIKLEIVPGTRR